MLFMGNAINSSLEDLHVQVTILILGQLEYFSKLSLQRNKIFQEDFQRFRIFLSKIVRIVQRPNVKYNQTDLLPSRIGPPYLGEGLLSFYFLYKLCIKTFSGFTRPPYLGGGIT